MFDAAARRLIDPPLNWLGARLAAISVSANTVTIVGFLVGLSALPLLAYGRYDWALIAILANRFSDGLDGAVARANGPTDLGGYLDIVCDFVFYATVVFGFALGQPEHAIPAAFLVVSFMGTGTTFLAFAAVASKHQMTTATRGTKSLYYIGGLTEGTETIAFFVAMCLWPQAFPILAWVFGGLCWLTTVSRVVTAYRVFGGR